MCLSCFSLSRPISRAYVPRPVPVASIDLYILSVHDSMSTRNIIQADPFPFF